MCRVYRERGKFVTGGLVLAVCLTELSFAAVQPEDRDLALENLVDPTAPLNMNAMANQPQTSAFNPVSSYRVSSILIRPNMKVAVINSRQVSEGDMIGNAEVVRIDKHAVTLLVAGEEQVLEIYGRSIKTLNENQGDE